MKNFKLGIDDNPGFDLPFEDRIATIKRVGFDACFTGWSDGCDVDHYANVIAKNGLIYQSIHAPFGRVDSLNRANCAVMWEDEGELGEGYTDMLIRCVKDAHRVGVPMVVIHPIIGMDRHTPSELGLKRYGRLIEAAEKENVLLGFENVEGIEYLDAIMERYADCKTAGFCWDTGHEMCYNFSNDVMAKYGKKLYGTHFNDNLGMENPNEVTWLDDLHLLPFDGIADWKNIMARINRDGYEGILTFELTIKNKPGKHTHDAYAAMEPEEFLAEAYARAQRILALAE